MTLHAVLSWYDESPSWLAACVASLERIGVQHVLAVDGRYPHFQPDRSVASPVDQADAIMQTAAAMGMDVTVHRPTRIPMMEPEKRELCHRLLERIAEPYKDWFIAIDGDEYIIEGHGGIEKELDALTDHTHCAAVRVSSITDPYAEPGPDNGVNDRTAETYIKLPVDPQYTTMQSRFWRVLTDMRVGPTHFHYTGRDASGQLWYLRPDIQGAKKVFPDAQVSEVHRCMDVTVMHRKNMRPHIRRVAKDAYYTTRDELGLERVPVAN